MWTAVHIARSWTGSGRSVAVSSPIANKRESRSCEGTDTRVAASQIDVPLEQCDPPNGAHRKGEHSIHAPARDIEAIVALPSPAKLEAFDGLQDGVQATTEVSHALITAAIEDATPVPAKCESENPSELPTWLDRLSKKRAAIRELVTRIGVRLLLTGARLRRRILLVLSRLQSAKRGGKNNRNRPARLSKPKSVSGPPSLPYSGMTPTSGLVRVTKDLPSRIFLAISFGAITCDVLVLVLLGAAGSLVDLGQTGGVATALLVCVVLVICVASLAVFLVRVLYEGICNVEARSVFRLKTRCIEAEAPAQSSRVTFRLELEPKPGWHVYPLGASASDAGVRGEIVLYGSKRFRLSDSAETISLAGAIVDAEISHSSAVLAWEIPLQLNQRINLTRLRLFGYVTVCAGRDGNLVQRNLTHFFRSQRVTRRTAEERRVPRHRVVLFSAHSSRGFAAWSLHRLGLRSVRKPCQLVNRKSAPVEAPSDKGLANRIEQSEADPPQRPPRLRNPIGPSAPLEPQAKMPELLRARFDQNQARAARKTWRSTIRLMKNDATLSGWG